MTTVADLDEGDWQQIILEAVYDRDSALLKNLVKLSNRLDVLGTLTVLELKQLAANYVQRLEGEWPPGDFLADPVFGEGV